MALAPITGLPGPSSSRTATDRRITNGPWQLLKPGGVTVDGSESRDAGNTGDLDVLRAGMLLGKITATGLYKPAIVGTLTVAHTGDSATTMTVGAATAVEIDRIASAGKFVLTGPPTAAGTVGQATITYSAVNTTTGVITVSTESTDFIVGSYVGGVHASTVDGSQNPMLIVGDGFGHKVTDADAASVDTLLGNVLVGGFIDSSQIVNWSSDTSIQKWIMAQLNSAAQAPVTAEATQGSFIFDHPY